MQPRSTRGPSTTNSSLLLFSSLALAQRLHCIALQLCESYCWWWGPRRRRPRPTTLLSHSPFLFYFLFLFFSCWFRLPPAAVLLLLVLAINPPRPTRALHSSDPEEVKTPSLTTNTTPTNLPPHPRWPLLNKPPPQDKTNLLQLHLSAAETEGQPNRSPHTRNSSSMYADAGFAFAFAAAYSPTLTSSQPQPPPPPFDYAFSSEPPLLSMPAMDHDAYLVSIATHLLCLLPLA
jgi:hypothetical protein